MKRAASVIVKSSCCLMQVQLLTVLVRLEEVPLSQVRDVYKLLLDDSHAVRHAAAELVTDMLEESGQRHLAQVMIAHPFSLLLSRLHQQLWLTHCSCWTHQKACSFPVALISIIRHAHKGTGAFLCCICNLIALDRFTGKLHCCVHKHYMGPLCL